MGTIRSTLILTLLVSFWSPASSYAAPAKGTTPRPKLILVIAIDQFRADYLTRFESRFGADGFRALMKTGAYYPFAQYDILQSMTGPGHATILTGSYPYQNGIGLNYWYDVAKKESVYCAEDSESLPIPASSAKPHGGTSPRNLLATTVGDEIKNAGFPSRVVSIAIKDRASILMGGHRADIALWFDTVKNSWVSSSFYVKDALPGWVNVLNRAWPSRVKELEATPIVVQGPGTGYSLADPMLKPGGFGKHVAGELVNQKDLETNRLLGEAVVNAAEHAFDQYHFGTGKGPDVLAVSLSSHDYLGHAYGPNSRELEEMTVYEDKLVARILKLARDKVPGGLASTTVVLTADHGIPPNPDWLVANGVDAGRVNEREWLSELNTRLDKKFGKSKEGGWLRFGIDFNYYINREALAAAKIDAFTIEGELKSILRERHEAAYVFSRTDVMKRTLPPGQHERQILKTYYPGRSGDVIMIPKPYFMPDGDTVTHMTGYNYDRTVPLILAGFGIKPGLHSEKSEVVDIAPTLSFLLGVLPPNLSEGRVLTEALAK